MRVRIDENRRMIGENGWISSSASTNSPNEPPSPSSRRIEQLPSNEAILVANSANTRNTSAPSGNLNEGVDLGVRMNINSASLGPWLNAILILILIFNIYRSFSSTSEYSILPIVGQGLMTGIVFKQGERLLSPLMPPPSSQSSLILWGIRLLAIFGLGFTFVQVGILEFLISFYIGTCMEMKFNLNFSLTGR